MSLSYALLVCLQEEPATGYTLAQRFQERLGNVWNVSHQQVYRELSRLLEKNWLVMEVMPQAGRPDRKYYTVTQAGEQALSDWLGKIAPRPAVRDPLLLKLFAGELWDIADARAELAHHRQQWQAQLLAYRALEKQYFAEPASLSRRYRMQYLALRRGILTQQAWLDWSEELLQLLE